MQSETQGLIRTEPAPDQPVASQVLLFLILQVFQVLWFVCNGFIPPGVFSLAHLALAFTNMLLCQSKIGRTLVGLSWGVDLSRSSGGLWVHRIEPDPFVPTKLNSNCFWIGISGSATLSVVIFFHVVLSGTGPIWRIVSLAAAAAYLLNLVVFFKMQQIASRASVQAVRTVLLGQNSAFPDAEEVSDSSGDAKPAAPEPVPQEPAALQTPGEEPKEEQVADPRHSAHEAAVV
jgi:hypothetical protein